MLASGGYTHGRSPWAFTLQSSNRNDLTRQGRAGILAVPNAFDATHPDAPRIGVPCRGLPSFDAAGQGAAAFNRKIIDIARRNLNSSFDLAKSLAGAKNLADMVELQMAYWQKQFGALTAQAEEVHALSTKLTVDTAEPIKALAARTHG